MDTACGKVFHQKMPTGVWILCVGGALCGLQKLFQSKYYTAIVIIAGAGYTALLCFVGWILTGAFT
jgi:hypothetical protein